MMSPFMDEKHKPYQAKSFVFNARARIQMQSKFPWVCSMSSPIPTLLPPLLTGR